VPGQLLFKLKILDLFKIRGNKIKTLCVEKKEHECYNKHQQIW
jgi:hypothetical protein